MRELRQRRPQRRRSRVPRGERHVIDQDAQARQQPRKVPPRFEDRRSAHHTKCQTELRHPLQIGGEAPQVVRKLRPARNGVADKTDDRRIRFREIATPPVITDPLARSPRRPL